MALSYAQTGPCLAVSDGKAPGEVRLLLVPGERTRPSLIAEVAASGDKAIGLPRKTGSLPSRWTSTTKQSVRAGQLPPLAPVGLEPPKVLPAPAPLAACTETS